MGAKKKLNANEGDQEHYCVVSIYSMYLFKSLVAFMPGTAPGARLDKIWNRHSSKQNKTDKHLYPPGAYISREKGNRNKQNKKVKYMKWKLVKNLWEKSKAEKREVILKLFGGEEYEILNRIVSEGLPEKVTFE